MVSDTKKKAFIECFSNFMSDSEGLSQEDLAAELKEQKTDVNQLKLDVAEIVKRGSEERRLGWRRRAKQKMEEIEKLLELTHTIPNAGMNVKDKITEFIKNIYGPGVLSHAEAYFRNKGTLSETDIMNLFEDLEQLDALGKSGFEKD
jgi:predicted transcriptional regulator